MQYQRYLQQEVKHLNTQQIIEFFGNEPELATLGSNKCKIVFMTRIEKAIQKMQLDNNSGVLYIKAIMKTIK